jgi:DNA-binding XRE family transcriptional regulator
LARNVIFDDVFRNVVPSHAVINIHVAQCHPSGLQTQRGRHHAYLYTAILAIYRYEVKSILMRLDPIDWQDVGKRIRHLRGFDMTQAEFAQRIDVSQSYLSAVEHGKSEIGAQVLLKISLEFGKSIEWLLTGKA